MMKSSNSWYLQSCPGNKPEDSAWQPGDKWPERSPVSPAPWSQAPIAAPSLRTTDGESQNHQAHSFKDANASLSPVQKHDTTKHLWASSSHLSFRVTVAVLVLVSQRKLQRITLLDLFIHHFFTHALCKEKARLAKQMLQCMFKRALTLMSTNRRTASISFRDFHCSYGSPRPSAVWIVLFIWLVHTFRSLIFWSWMNFLRLLANWEV